MMNFTCLHFFNEFHLFFLAVRNSDGIQLVHYLNMMPKVIVMVVSRIYFWLTYRRYVSNIGDFQRFVASDKHFDVVLVEPNYCEELIGFGHHLNAPIISISPSFYSSELEYGFTASPALKSFIPSEYLNYSDRMNFWQRLHIQITHLLHHLVVTCMRVESVWQEDFEFMFPNMKGHPSFTEIRRNVSLVLLNSITTIEAPRPLMPHIINVGGLITRPENSEELPRNLQLYLDNATLGAVFVSFGSFFKNSKLPSNVVQSILGAISELSDIKFLLKADNDFISLYPNVSSNVLIHSWFPQKAILKHSNVKGFVNHAGLNSVQESIFYGKPIVGIPFAYDQFAYARWAHEKGYGIELKLDQITRDTLKSAIQDIVNNSRFVELSNFRSSELICECLF